MNIHPLFVHFPIALLTSYAVFEIISFGKLQKNVTWNFVKGIFVLTGFISALITLQTGELAAEILGKSDLIKMHSFFATIATWIFVLPSFAYGIFFLNHFECCHSVKTKIKNYRLSTRVFYVCNVLSRILLKRWILMILAVAGFTTMMVTGALGGAIVYGKDVDPVVRFVVDFLM
ncbi:hypothetical protein HZA38_05575 [Candidatus Peregrinibacteria bacterium]|nr:hypothetical protein [Candidatus Peregrinibacteria bacterium]